MIKILVITSCTGEKKSNPNNKLTINDFRSIELLKLREKELKDYTLPASDMYTGMQHLRLMEGIKSLRSKFNNNIVDLAIVSAGYGLLNENDMIVPYEVTFNEMNNNELIEWSNHLEINEKLSQLVKEYDLVFFLLGDTYLRSLRLPLDELDEDKKLIFMSSKTSKKLIPASLPYYFIEVGQNDAKSFSYGLIGLKGYLFKLLSQDVVENGLKTFEAIYQKPDYIMDLLNKYRVVIPQYDQLDMTIFNTKDKVLDLIKPKVKKENKKKKNMMIVTETVIHKENYAKNYGYHMMRYFIPECDDRVDKKYDFIKDCSEKDRDVYQNDVYAHEIYNKPNYDGILVSKMSIEASKTKKKSMEEIGVHSYIRYPKNNPVMGDCGAFSYIDKENPPYKTEEILEYYEKLGFDIGVSIDHLIIGNIAKDPNERVRRYNITRNNAEEFINMHREKNCNFIPSGIAQGWDPISYRESVANLIDMGYKHISIGGLAYSPTTEIMNTLKEISPVVQEDIEMHLFGVQRLDAIEDFRKLGITSFDSSSYLRKAWTDKKRNYFSGDGNNYSAIRIPQSHGKIVKSIIEKGEITLEEFIELEKKSLETLRKYSKGEVDLNDTLEIILSYTELTGKSRNDYAESYKRTLIDKPWEKCDCNICRDAGIETIIFRGNNRNRRRGFHNTYVFYKLFQELLNK
jgi:hypothetical protein